jgi:hypothetical protein
MRAGGKFIRSRKPGPQDPDSLLWSLRKRPADRQKQKISGKYENRCQLQ